MCATSHADQIRAEALPSWLDWIPKMPFAEMARHSMDFWLSSEDLPRPENRIFYDGDRVVLALTENNMEGHRRLKKKLEQHMSAAGRTRCCSSAICISAEHPGRGHRAPGGHPVLRDRPRAFGARSELQGARVGQSLCHRCEFLSLHRLGEPDPDHHRQRVACRRASAPALGA